MLLTQNPENQTIFEGELDPLAVANKFWKPPEGRKTIFYEKQEDIIYSVWNNDETIVPAGNMLGKDFVAARIVLLFFLTRQPCRIVTTSAKDRHMDVLWSEIDRAIEESQYDMSKVLVRTHHQIKRKLLSTGKVCPMSIITGQVASTETIAGLQGYHLPRKNGRIPTTLFVADEASSVADEIFDMCSTWAHRMLIIGNPWDCDNYFYRAVMGSPAHKDPGGDIGAED